MFFDYSQYYQVNLLLPLERIAVGIIGLVIFIAPQIGELINDPLKSLHLITPILIAGTILVAFIASCGHPFWNGGYHLFSEKPKDAICINGKIESISECSSLRCLNYKTVNGPSQGYEIMVNGKAYLAMDHVRYSVGRDATLTVLPRSRIVLCMVIGENE